MSRSGLLLVGSLAVVAVTLALFWPEPVRFESRHQRDAIYWAADYLADLQEADGSWSLEEGEAAEREAVSVLGRALLHAASITGSERHREAALRAADALLVSLEAVPASAQALDGIFLVEVAEATGEDRYREAGRHVHWLRRLVRRWPDGRAAATSYREIVRSVPRARRNVVVWRALDDVDLATRIGENTFAEEMGRTLVHGLELDPSAPAGTLAASRAVVVLGALEGNRLEGRVQEWLGRLRRAQSMRGLVPGDGAEGFVYSQDAAHALLAFMASRDGDLWSLAREGSLVFVDRQLEGTDGSWAPVIELVEHADPAVASPPAPGVTADVLIALVEVHSGRGVGRVPSSIGRGRL